MLLDERADRKDIDVRVISSGAKLGEDQSNCVSEKMVELKPDIAIVTSPNATLPGPTKIRLALKDANIPTIVVSDGPGKKAAKSIEESGQGYIIVEADSMIGARREFLDPVEMSIFNADIVKVLAITGAFDILRDEIDKSISAIKNSQPINLPRIIVKKENAVEASGLKNPYARAKAIAAYEVAKRVADLTVEGCFMVQEWERYTPLVAAGHEMLAAAARLADDARSIEKSNDSVVRKPHYKDGSNLIKSKLIEKPSST